jgi:hypothetical protein
MQSVAVRCHALIGDLPHAMLGSSGWERPRDTRAISAPNLWIQLVAQGELNG